MQKKYDSSSRKKHKKYLKNRRINSVSEGRRRYIYYKIITCKVALDNNNDNDPLDGQIEINSGEGEDVNMNGNTIDANLNTSLARHTSDSLKPDIFGLRYQDFLDRKQN